MFSTASLLLFLVSVAEFPSQCGAGGAASTKPLPPFAVGRSWSARTTPWQILPFESQVYGIEGSVDSLIPASVIQVLDGLSGTTLASLTVPLGPSYNGAGACSVLNRFLSHRAFLIAGNGDVILRTAVPVCSTFTSTALRRYSLVTKRLVWVVPIEGADDTGTVGVLSGDYLYTTVGPQLYVISVASGTVVSSFHDFVAPLHSLSSSANLSFSRVQVAQPKGTPGWLIVDQGSAVQGYSLANPVFPTMAWNATDARTGSRLVQPSAPKVSLDGRWLVGCTFGTPRTTIVVVDTSTGAARSHSVKDVPTIWGASGTLAMLSTSRQHGTVVRTTYGAFNLTSMEFAQPTRPHFVGGAVQCGLATDGSVFVCATQTFSTDSTSTADAIGFTVFDATTTGAVVAQYARSIYDKGCQHLDSEGLPISVVPSADGHWYNVFLSNTNLAMIQLPRGQRP